MKEKRDDYNIVFEQQKRFLLKSCTDFDKGEEAEAIRIAGHLRTILHDSYQKKNFDTKLSDILTEIRVLISPETFGNKIKVLNKLNGLRQKIEQQQKIQILSKSLLTQLRLKHKLKFLDTALPKNSFSFYEINSLTNTHVILKSYYGLLAKNISVNEGKEVVKYLPLCLKSDALNYFKSCPLLNFDDWWHKEIYNDGDETVFRRKDLVTFVANHNGYAHMMRQSFTNF